MINLISAQFAGNCHSCRDEICHGDTIGVKHPGKIILCMHCVRVERAREAEKNEARIAAARHGRASAEKLEK